MTSILVVLATAVVSAVAPAGPHPAAPVAPHPAAPVAGPPASAVAAPDTVLLVDGLGEHHRAITTDDPLAQRYFDQGLRYTYAFNHHEAVRAFEQAARLDPSCAKCWWGAALAHGPNINLPMDSAAAVEAWRALEKARERLDDESEAERALIGALGERYAFPPPTERAGLDSAYARSMAEYVERWPEDLDGAVLYAESLMLLRPWDYWTPDGEMREGTETILAVLERTIEAAPDHPGACHFYIHAVEAAEPDRAVACAERLAGLMPAAGHIVHMPGHVYIRVGRYADAVDANVHAVHLDEDYIADRGPTGIYTSGYYPHNYHFLAFAAMMAGMSERALHGAKRLTETIDHDLVPEVYFLEQTPAYLQLVRVTFGRWDEILADERPSEALPVAHGMDAYARGVALAATGRCGDAEAELDRVRSKAAERAAGPQNPGAEILPIARDALVGEIALRCASPAEAVPHFENAVALENALQYDEPPLWYYPVRHSLGRALLEAGRPAEAEAVYRRDLERFPRNGWSLYGLAAALEVQGKDAAAVRERLDGAWENADLELTASRF